MPSKESKLMGPDAMVLVLWMLSFKPALIFQPLLAQVCLPLESLSYIWNSEFKPHSKIA